MMVIFKTQNTWSLLVIRVALGFTLLAHGAQKLLGVFGGFGFSHTMSYFTDVVHLPYLIGVVVILLEFFGSILIAIGFFTRPLAAMIIMLFIGIAITHHLKAGFFMDFFGQNPPGYEGVEFDLVMIGIALALLLGGAGKYSADRLIYSKFKLDSN